jgi:hypothetical protein
MNLMKSIKKLLLLRCGGFLVLCAGLSLAFTSPISAQTATQAKFFKEKVKPLLESRCFKCHGAKPKLKGKFSVASRAAILKGGDSGPGVSLTKPASSLLLEAIGYADEDLQMPPKEKLPKHELDILNQWVKMGSPWPTGTKLSTAAIEAAEAAAKNWWAYQPIKRHPAPTVRNKSWVKNPIDAFILAKLETAGLKPAPRADKVALIRRVTYNLTGLPPTPEQVATFVADRSPKAYEKLIDRLLASPQYGEKWARHWLDVVRYAETNGYERDATKPFAWRYRDYIIKAFNEDKPYDQFIIEQLAGDEMKNMTPDALIATGYYRLGIWNDEPADGLKHKYDILDGILSTTGQVMMATTIGCARCHTHKKDPIPHKDYYRMLSFFKDVSNMSKNPTRSIASPQLKAEYEKKLKEKQDAERGLQQQINAIQKDFDKAASAADRKPKKGTANSTLLDDSRTRGQIWSYTFAKPANDWFKTNFNDRAWKKGPGGFGRDGTPKAVIRTQWTSNDIWLRKTFKVSALPRSLTITINHDENAIVYLNGKQIYKIAGHSASYKTAKLSPDALRAIKPGENIIAVHCHQTTGGQYIDLGLNVEKVNDKKQGKIDDRIRARGRELIGKPKVDQYFKLRKQYDQVRRRRLPEPGMKVMAVAESGRAKTFVFGRGNPTMAGDEVKPGYLEVLGFADPVIAPSKSGTSGKRIVLAKWLVDKKNPLPSRAMINRIWQHQFGRGIVSTPNDFGALGRLPTHPKLLDWLASEFMNRNWSIKSMQKLIMMSNTFQMASTDNAAALAKDPDNELFWRFNMRRLTAEEIRDSILQVNGSLNLQMGGPSFYTEVPKEVLATASKPNNAWGRSPDDQKVRRSVYIVVKRSLVEPLLRTFDSADTDNSCAVRFATTVPTQSLTMLNSKFFNDEAAKLAARLRKEAGADPSKQIALAFSLTTGRKPKADEVRNGVAFMKRLQVEEKVTVDQSLDYFCLIAINLNEFLYLD